MQEPGVVIRVPLGLSRRSATGLVAVLFSVSLVFVAGTAVFIRYPRAAGGEWADAGWPKLILIQLHLGAENEAAAWFASMVLLLVAVGAAMCFLADRAAQPPSGFVRVAAAHARPDGGGGTDAGGGGGIREHRSHAAGTAQNFRVSPPAARQ